MKRILLAGILFSTAASLPAVDLPPLVREALTLELQGRLGESLDRYRAALSSVPELSQDDDLARPLTITVLSKAAHLSLDLGYGEEAWDLTARLLASRAKPALEAGTLVRLRILRVQKRWAEAQSLYDGLVKSLAPGTPGAAVLAEAQRLKSESGLNWQPVARVEGPASWLSAGRASLLPSPADAWSLSLQETVRLQIGAFKDWNHALTLIDMLREKGWVPFTDVKLAANGDKLHLVYVVSRQPAADRARLDAQGLTQP